MTPLRVLVEGHDQPWPDLANADIPIHTLESMALVLNATANGKPAVWFRIDLPDGSHVLAQTTLGLLETAMQAFRGRIDRPDTNEPPPTNGEVH